jgi:glycerophosphoryl diester phosphodiesterase
MALLMATISGQFLKPDLGKSARTYVIEAATDASRLEVSGKVIEGRIPVKIRTDGTATVTIPQLPQAGLSPVGAQWALYRRRDGRDVLVKTFTLTGDITWDAIVDTSNVPVTPALVAQAQQARDAAVAAAASVKIGTWQATTAYVTDQTVQAPDGTLIKSLSSRTSRASFDATEQANWTPVVTKAGTLAQIALAAATADAAAKAAWQRAIRVDDITWPQAIAHRGAGDIAAENTVDAYKYAAANLGFQVIEAGDIQALSDGTLVSMHDSTVDRTTTGTGAVNAFTKATWASLLVDIATTWGGAYTSVPAPYFDDIGAQLAGKAIIMPEVKDGLDSTATAICDRLDILGARDSVIITSFTRSNLVIAAARGYKTMMVANTFADLVTAGAASLLANGIWSVCVSFFGGDWSAGNVAAWKAAGFRVFADWVDHQADAASIVASGADGYFTDEPKDWIIGNATAYRKVASNWHNTGKWEPGMVTQGLGPYVASGRGTIVGAAPGIYRVRPGSTNVVLGQLCPVVNAAGTYTVTVQVAVDTTPTTTANGPEIYVAMPDDRLTADPTNNEPALCYIFKARASGVCEAWSNPASGAAVSLGTITCTAFQNLTLTAARNAGTTYTTLTVSALTVALKVGHQFLLPNGQIVTVAVAASIGATSVTVNSFTPVVTVPSGGVAVPYLTMVATITPTNVSFQRGDESAVGSISAANTLYRGGWLGLSGTSFASGQVSYHKVTVT